ncbi:hypothetical protein LTR56_027673 [Elasticomyces elasticus]|nr:hypothetical protein LTR56_027673 [Elasticomyces elasticus]KAK3614710.1 hypothetical protein LTR22_027689 [Elasticomyces elasticus]KAK4895496.1 hypothetical protein LTR49_028275 [Elasticomyces elasticus]
MATMRHNNFLSTGRSPTSSSDHISWDRESKFLEEHTAIPDGHTIGELKCGATWQEAKASGCRFDIPAGRWYSEVCASFDVLDVMLQEIQLEWFADEEHIVPVSQEVAYAGEYEWLYPLHDYHVLHCLYLWRCFHIAVLEYRMIDADLLSYGHTLHCTKMIMKWPQEIRRANVRDAM